ncbi:hypothetical protein AB5Q79_001613 [Campylobacter jejuni]
MTRIIEVNNIDWTALQLEAGDYSISTTQANGVYYLSENEDGENAIQSNGTINITTQETRTIYLKSSNANGRISVSNFFFNKLKGGGGSQPTPIQLTFNSPLNKEGDAVSLKTDDNFSILENGNLSLNLQSNTDFQKLSQQVTQLVGLTLQFIGQINNTRAEVVASTQLLTDFVNERLSRAPKNGDLVLTSDAYAFVYDNQSQSWTDFGNAIIQVATTTSAGVIKLGTAEGELQDNGDGKAGVIGWGNVAFKNKEQIYTKLQKFTDVAVFAGFRSSVGSISIEGSGERYIRWSATGGNKFDAGIGFLSGENRNNLEFQLKSSGVFLFERLVRYKYNLTPSDDKDLVPKSYVDGLVNQLTQEINQLKAQLNTKN